VAGVDDMWGIYAYRAGHPSNLHFLVSHPVRGIISNTPWVLGGLPRRLTGISLREDGSIFVHLHGPNGFKALRPICD
jgi:hypothetical protein